ncbi:MAG: AMIN domain-containing protein [Deltaproteobacteria bacterium]|nr:AMIN domain-containing protein [Deltaproteobacteria bacterium]
MRPLPGDGGKVEIRADVDLTGRYLTRMLEAPPRFVVDIPGIKRSGSLRSRGRVGKLIRRYRVGRHPDSVRVVFDLAKAGRPDVTAKGRELIVTMR